MTPRFSLCLHRMEWQTPTLSFPSWEWSGFPPLTPSSFNIEEQFSQMPSPNAHRCKSSPGCSTHLNCAARWPTRPKFSCKIFGVRILTGTSIFRQTYKTAGQASPEILTRLCSARGPAKSFQPLSRTVLIIHCMCLSTPVNEPTVRAAAYLCHSSSAASLLFSKCPARVARVKARIIPELELLAVAIGVWPAEHLATSFPAAKTYFWSDSQIVLCWLSDLKSSGKIFVKNRVEEVLAKSS